MKYFVWWYNWQCQNSGTGLGLLQKSNYLYLIKQCLRWYSYIYYDKYTYIMKSIIFKDTSPMKIVIHIHVMESPSMMLICSLMYIHEGLMQMWITSVTI